MNDRFYSKLLDEWCPRSSNISGYICAFNKVRDIPYGSTGERDPQEIVRNNLGSCSGKHILLHNLFKKLGMESKVVTCLEHFDRALPPDNDYPEELKKIMREHRVIDFHHFIKLKINEDWLNVDVTWDPPLKDYGFPVNLDWNGMENTTVAVEPLSYYPDTEDIIGLKKRLIAELTSEERAIRTRFLKLLTDWLQGIRSRA